MFRPAAERTRSLDLDYCEFDVSEFDVSKQQTPKRERSTRSPPTAHPFFSPRSVSLKRRRSNRAPAADAVAFEDDDALASNVNLRRELSLDILIDDDSAPSAKASRLQRTSTEGV